MSSRCPGPLVSVGGWIKGGLWMFDQDEPEGGRGRWGRESELDEEPTLLHDSEPEGTNREIIKSLLRQTINFLELL